MRTFLVLITNDHFGMSNIQHQAYSGMLEEGMNLKLMLAVLIDVDDLLL